MMHIQDDKKYDASKHTLFSWHMPRVIVRDGKSAEYHTAFCWQLVLFLQSRPVVAEVNSGVAHYVVVQ